ncbi:MAG: hypothetical protein ACJ71N_10580 [Terriglobales bacterium]|jgi:hypothetical protein
MRLGRLLILLGLFAFVGEVANTTINSFGPVPKCNVKHPTDPRCF